MKKSSQNGIDLFNFGIPAFRSKSGLSTCPNARQCATGCYAQSGTYRFGNVVNAYEQRLQLTQSVEFVDIMIAEIRSKMIQSKMKGRQCVIRIHDSGDFYSKEYAIKWLYIIEALPQCKFYAYTKMVSMFETFKQQGFHFENFRLIYSLGGSEDSQIDTESHFHSKVFQSETALIEAGYSDASQDDTVAAIGPCKKIGLVYHGVKNYAKTAWSKVS